MSTQSDKLAAINELNSLAADMRDRQEAICSAVRNVTKDMSDAIALAAEQGQDCLKAKIKLPKGVRWSEWLRAHVPNMDEAQAARYERVSTEHIDDVRQCIFAFFPPTPQKQIVERIKPNPWEHAWGYVSKFKRTLIDAPINDWPAAQVEATRNELEPVAKVLWPERFTGPPG